MKKKIFIGFLVITLSFIFTTSVAAYNFGDTTLRNGSSGKEVIELQRFLNVTLNLELIVDGKLGKKTITVIKKWQKDNGLIPDGIVGVKTKTKMYSIDNRNPTPNNDKDIHGCINSAGYQYCEIKKKCLRTWEEPCIAQTPVIPKHCLSNGICFDNRVSIITEGVDGNFINSENRALDSSITKYYSQNTQKEVDFLIAFKDWDAPAPGAYSIFISSNENGMGLFERKDDQYGSKGNLKSFIIMPNVKELSIQNYANDMSTFNSTVSTFVHEIGHHWLTRLDNPLLLISDTSNHYDSCMTFNSGTFSDLMMKSTFIWSKTSNTTFTSPPPSSNFYDKKFSNLSLYIMGLLPNVEVTPVQIIEDGSKNCPWSNGKFENGVSTITGTANQINLSDLIKIYGERNPKFPNTQKDFTIQVVLVAHQNSKLTQEDSNMFSKYLDEIEKYLPFAFSNKANFQLIKE